MELECAKYHEKMDSERARCKHPGDYCQHRQSCMIHFIEQDNKRNSVDCDSVDCDKPNESGVETGVETAKKEK